jgi:hypothetical protein
VAAKPPAGTSMTGTLSVPSGAYRVRLPSVTVEGVRYVGRASRGTVVVRRARSSGLLVRYVPDGGARQLRATAVGQTGLTLSWTAPPGARLRLRRAVGDLSVARRWRGIPVPVNGTTAWTRGSSPASGTRARCSRGSGAAGSARWSWSPALQDQVDKYSFFGAEVPVGASVDMGLTAKASAARRRSRRPASSDALSAPESSSSPSHQRRFRSGKALLAASPLSPKVTANGTVNLRVGGELVLGPGAGTVQAGAIAGLSGDLYPVDAGWGPYLTAQDGRFNACVKAEVKRTAALGLIAKAWLGKWSISQKVTLDALEGSKDYPGSPWFLPSGCKDLPAPEPEDSLLGPGVVKVGDSTVGSAWAAPSTT